MTESRTVISIRGDAQREVPPDLATMYGSIRAIEASKAAALQSVAEQADTVFASLRELGGTSWIAGDQRRPLTWLSRSATTRSQLRMDEQRHRRVRTGKVVAVVSLLIQLRDFTLIDRVSAALAAIEGYHGGNVAWSADNDNPGWREVRADAIAAAIDKARDYATALGGRLVELEHLADVGLLAGAGDHHPYAYRESAEFAAMSRGGARRAAPSLDPEPQLLAAAVDARFVASVAELGQDLP